MPGQVSSILTEISEIAGWVVSALFGIVLGASHTRKRLKSDSKEVARDEAHTDVIQLLREEVRRLAEQNKRLTEVVDELQKDVQDLRNENIRLQHAYNAAMSKDNVTSGRKRND